MRLEKGHTITVVDQKPTYIYIWPEDDIDSNGYYLLENGKFIFRYIVQIFDPYVYASTREAIGILKKYIKVHKFEHIDLNIRFKVAEPIELYVNT